MKNFEDFKSQWAAYKQWDDTASLDAASWKKIINARVNHQRNVSMKYFWASFTLHLIVYALLSHVIIRFGSDEPVLIVCVLCFLLYLPFTYVLMKKFRRLAALHSEVSHHSGLPIREYVKQQYDILTAFYRFKKRYELILVPVSSAVMIWVFFRVYMPGGIIAYPVLGAFLFIATLGCCTAAILAENKKRFQHPIAHLESILQDTNEGS